MEAKHTPGPYTVVGRSGRPGDPFGARVCRGGRNVAAGYTPDDARQVADALNACEGIADPAAVKDLLAACEEARDLLDHDDTWGGLDEPHRDALNTLRAALARARGER